MSSLLENLTDVSEIKSFKASQLRQLAQELRDSIVDTVSKNGGHLASSLGVVELSIALHRVFDTPKDKLIWDVGHQASLTAGMALEALNQAGHLKKDLIVILNDNEMSISPNVGALSSFLNKKMTSRGFQHLRREAENILGHVPRFGKELLNLAHRAEESLKGFFTPGMLFEAFGFDYVGPIEGHQLEDLIATLENVSEMKGPILIHLITEKGKGYAPAEKSPSKFHGVGPFDKETGEIHSPKPGPPSYTTVFGETMVELAQEDRRVVAITAAMKAGTGLTPFAEAFPDRFFDVGIAEQHAVTFAAGLACEGLRPVVAIYSSFMQRAYDNVLHDVCLQNLPVSFALDRGGLVGADGPTHHGVFDYSFMRHIPNMTFAVPRDEQMLRRIMRTSLDHDGPFAYRFPRGNGLGLETSGELLPLHVGKGEKLREGKDGVILALGVSVQEALGAAELLAAEGIEMAVIDPVFLKPLDAELILAEAGRTGLVVTVEENQLEGGFGSAVLEGTQKELRAQTGIDSAGIAGRIKAHLRR